MTLRRNLAIMMALLLVFTASLPMYAGSARAEQTLTELLQTQYAGRSPVVKGGAESSAPSEGDTLTFRLEPRGYEGLSYAIQWQKDGRDIQGASDLTLSIQVSASNAGSAYGVRLLISGTDGQTAEDYSNTVVAAPAGLKAPEPEPAPAPQNKPESVSDPEAPAEEPAAPDEPEAPSNEAEAPAEPEAPVDPETPVEVEAPAEPEAPAEEPAAPVEEPEAPAEEPAAPAEPEAPSNEAEAPAEPEAPVDPETSVEVEAPAEPEAPAEEPAAPVEEPEAPAEEPAAPAEPEAPVDPETPVEVEAPAEPEAPAEEPAAPAEPEVPAEEPVAPTEEPESPTEEPESPSEEPAAPTEEPESPAEEPAAPADPPKIIEEAEISIKETLTPALPTNEEAEITEESPAQPAEQKDLTLISETEVTSFLISFFAQEGELYSSYTAEKGQPVQAPEAPQAPEGLSFAYWYLEGGDASLPYDLGRPVTAALRLVARFAPKASDELPEPVPVVSAVAFSASVQLEGRPLEENEFRFALMDASGGLLQTVSNAADGSITFEPISFSADQLGGVYEYTVAQLPGEAEGLVYDGAVLRFAVQPVENEDGDISALLSAPEDTVFNNVYQPLIPLVQVYASMQPEQLFHYGDTLTLLARLINCGQSPLIQWQFSPDGADWMDIPGATDETLNVQLTANNGFGYWRVKAVITD